MDSQSVKISPRRSRVDARSSKKIVRTAVRCSTLVRLCAGTSQFSHLLCDITKA